MDEAKRETLCSSCSHRNVCVNKNYYLNMVKSLQEMFYKFPDNERVYVSERSVLQVLFENIKHTKTMDDMKTVMKKNGSIIFIKGGFVL